MFMNWKNQYSENEYTTQSNLQIQCNPYQAKVSFVCYEYCYSSFPLISIFIEYIFFYVIKKIPKTKVQDKMASQVNSIKYLEKS